MGENMSDVYFEAMEFHTLEQEAKLDKHADGYDRWVQETTDTYEYIQFLVKRGMPLGEEELTFLMRHAAENILKKAETAEYEFFAHHFDRVRRQEKIDQETRRKNKLIDEYSSTLKEIANAHIPIFGARKQLEAVQKDAVESLVRGQRYV